MIEAHTYINALFGLQPEINVEMERLILVE